MSLDFYRQPSASTDPGAHADLLNNLPTDLPGLHEVGRNVMIHIWKIRKFHPHLLDQRNILMYRMEDMLAEIRKRNGRPLTEDRPVEQKLIVDCRHFAGFCVRCCVSRGFQRVHGAGLGFISNRMITLRRIITRRNTGTANAGCWKIPTW